MKRYLYCAGILLSSAITSVQATDIQGFWKVNAYDAMSPSGANGDWMLGIKDGIIYGSAYWHVQKPDYTYENIDRLVGSVNANQVSITRYLSPAMFAGKTQTFTGTISGSNVSGTWSGTGCTSSCTWTATITPPATSTPTCPVVTCPTVPSCPTIPSCPAVTTTSNATFNFNTGRLVIPNLAVSMTAPFGGAEQVFNYGIEMQQRTGAFVFDLDLSKVVQR